MKCSPKSEAVSLLLLSSGEQLNTQVTASLNKSASSQTAWNTASMLRSMLRADT